jgi:ankyrin repeat protein
MDCQIRKRAFPILFLCAAFFVPMLFIGCDLFATSSRDASDTLTVLKINISRYLIDSGVYAYPSLSDLSDTIFTKQEPEIVDTVATILGLREQHHTGKKILLEELLIEDTLTPKPMSKNPLVIFKQVDSNSFEYDTVRLVAPPSVLKEIAMNKKPFFEKFSSTQAEMENITEGFVTTVPLLIHHFSGDGTTFSCKNIPDFIKVDTTGIDSLERINFYNDEPARLPISANSKVLRPAIRFAPTYANKESVYTWTLIVRNELGSEDSIVIHTKINAYPGKISTPRFAYLVAETIRQGNLDSLKRLFDFPLDPNIQEDGGGTPLAIAAKGAHYDIVDFLVGQGATLPPADTAVQIAVVKQIIAEGRSDLLDIISRQIDLKKFRDGSGYTALMLAASIRNFEMCEFLIKAGSDLDYQAPDGKRALSVNASDSLQMMLVQAGADFKFAEYNYPAKLGAAIKRGNIQFLQYFLEKGANPNAVEIPETRTVLLGRAILSNSLSATKALVEKGADPNYATRFASALSLAGLRGNSEIIKYLILHGASVHQEVRYTPLTYCLVREGGNWIDPLADDLQTSFQDTTGLYNVVKTFLENGADPNIASGAGITPLVAAATGSFFNVCQLLVEHGADVNSKGEYNRTPLSHSMKNENFVDFLIAHGADVNAVSEGGRPVIFDAAAEGNLHVLEALASAGADINKTDNKNVNAVIISTAEHPQDIVNLSFFLDRHVNVNQRDIGGNTALLNAVVKSLYHHVIALVDAGADLTMTYTRYKMTVLDFAIPGDSIATYLESKGAKKSVK